MSASVGAIAATVIGIGLLVGVALAPGRAEENENATAPLTQALQTEEARDGATSPDLLPYIERLAQAEWRAGSFADAATLRRRALDIAVAAFGCGSASAGEAMATLAFLDIDRRRYLDAEALLIIAEHVLEDQVADDQPVMARIFAERARIALARGETALAEASAERALAIGKRNPHGRSAEPLRTLGAVLTAEERFAEAEQVLTEAVAQDRRQHGSNGEDAARSLAQLAKLHLRQGKAGAALPLLEEATAIDQSQLGPTHPFIADDLHDLGLVYDALHRDEEARRAFTAAFAILEHGAGRETPRVAYTEIELSRLYRQAGNAPAAAAAFRDARRILNKEEAEEHNRERNL